MIAESPVEENTESEIAVAGILCKLEPGKFYSVPIGSNPGVYTSWSEVEAIKKEVHSIPPELQPKAHATYEEAWERVFPGQPLPRQEGHRFKDDGIRQYMQMSEGAVFNFALDIPMEVTRGLLQYFHTDSFASLPAEQLQRLIEQDEISAE